MHEVTWRVDGLLLDALTALGAPVERVEAGAYLVTVHGRRRPASRVWLIAGEQGVAVEAFVLHVRPGDCPDPAALHRHLLIRNLRLRLVAYGLDDIGDVFVRGTLPLLTSAKDASTAELSAAAVDAVLGEVAQALEDDHDTLLGLAYGERLPADPALSAKVRSDGAGRRPAGTPLWAPHRDARR